jgi:hypothetical protein
VSETFEPVASRCLVHPPGTPPGHMCIHETSWWLPGPDGWVRIEWPKSAHKARAWLALCETWDDVLSLAPDLVVGSR